MPFSWSDKHIVREAWSCLSGNEKSCAILDLYVAFGVLEAMLGKELNLVLDIDPDGAAATPTRFFPYYKLSASELKSKLISATNFRQALSKTVSILNEEIRELELSQTQERP